MTQAELEIISHMESAIAPFLWNQRNKSPNTVP